MYYFCHVYDIVVMYFFFCTLNIQKFNDIDNSYSLVNQKNSYLFFTNTQPCLCMEDWGYVRSKEGNPFTFGSPSFYWVMLPKITFVIKEDKF